MIKKRFRLSEREVKKVLGKGKPFFSYGVVLNSIPNILPYHRFAVVIGSKSVTNNITRNFFRRKFYNLMAGYITQDMGQQKKGQYRDMVFVVKKTTALDKKETGTIHAFEKDIQFLIHKLPVGNKY